LTGLPPFAGVYVFDVERETARSIEAGPGFNFLSIRFANDLSSAPDPLGPIVVATGSRLAQDFAPTGFVVPAGAADPIPEPSSLPLLGAALGLLPLGARTIGRARRGT
jgi:hypothetical protein